MGGGAPKLNVNFGAPVKVPTLGEIVNTATDVVSAYYSGGYTLTEPGKKDLAKLKGGITQVQEKLTGHTGRVRSETEAANQAALQRETEAKMAEQNLLSEQTKKYSMTRTRQKSLMGVQTGRAGTILTGTSKQNPNSLGSSPGKSLLGQ